MKPKHLLTLVISILFTQNLQSQNYAPKEVHYGEFYNWSPLANEGIRFSGRQDSGNIYVDGNAYSFNNSDQNLFMLRVNPDGSLKSSVFAKEKNRESSPFFVNTPKGTYIVGGLAYSNGGFFTNKFTAKLNTNGCEEVGYLGYFEDNPKPKRFFQASGASSTDFSARGPEIARWNFDEQGNMVFFMEHDGFRSQYKDFGYFNMGGIRWKHFGRYRQHERKYLGVIGDNFSSGCELEFVSQGSLLPPYSRGDGGYFITAITSDSILIQKNGITTKIIEVKARSHVILEFNKKSNLVNYLVSPQYPFFSDVVNKKMRFGVKVDSGTTAIKLGDSTFSVSSNTIENWLFELQPSGKVKKILTHQPIAFGKWNINGEHYKGYHMFMTNVYGNFEYKGERYYFPKSGQYPVETILDSNYNILNMFVGRVYPKFAPNGDVVTSQPYYNGKNRVGPIFPDSIKNALKPKDRIFYRYDNGFIYSRIVDSVFSYCPGQPVHMKPMSLDTFDTTNVFTMELSDTSGSFANPTVIGTLKSSVLDTVIGYIPNTVPGAKRYRVRLVSSSPKHIGIDNSFDLEIKEPVSRPNASDVYYCVGETPAALTPSGPGIRWYTNPPDTVSGGISTPPTPSTAKADIITYLVTQPDTVCAISWRLVDVNVMAPNHLPVAQNVNYCVGDSAVALSPSNPNIFWYTDPSDTTNNGSITPPIPNTTQAGSTNYLVAQYDSVCGDTNHLVTTLVKQPYSLPTVSDTSYCADDTAVAVGPSGNGLLWYANPLDTSGKGSLTAPVPSTITPGIQNYLVSGPYDAICAVPTKVVKVNVMAPLDTPVITQADTLLISSISKNIQWSKDGSAISGATNDTLKHSGAGVYGVVHTDSNGCKSSATWTIKNVSSTEMFAQAWSAYPNPFRDQILVEHIALKSIKLINQQGQVVLEGRSAQLSTENIVPGLYHLEVTSLDGSISRKKMVKY